MCKGREARKGEGRIEEKTGEEQGKGVGREQDCVTYQSKKRGGDARGEERTRGEHMVDGWKGEERGGMRSRANVRRGGGRGA